MLDFIRIAAAVPAVIVGDVRKNADDICQFMEQADDRKADILVFPELALTGYSCQDLFFQDAIYQEMKPAMRQIAACSAAHPALTAVVGLPIQLGMQIFNCAAVISDGIVRGVVTKTFLPNYNEFYEKRWFSPSEDMQEKEIDLKVLGLEGTAPVEKQMLFRLGDGTLFGAEICEDLWTPLPPSTILTLGGAEVIVNLSASNETSGKHRYRRQLVKQHSAATTCVYAYCSAGSTESTQDVVFSGHSIVAENGVILGENEKMIDSDYLLIRDCDLGKVRSDRRKNKSFKDVARLYQSVVHPMVVDCGTGDLRSDGTLSHIRRLPFVPSSRENRLERCREIFDIQVAGLKHRLETIHCNIVIGVSGGLDSTLALLVAVEAMKELNRPTSDVYGITMPCFGTTDRTYQNSLKLMKVLGVSSKEINIRNAVETHFQDIGHNPNIFDATFENSQARERTQILMDFASTVGGIVLGTGDLSELALGWCTYNGDHMSMYGVNASIPKTLIRWMVKALGELSEFKEAQPILEDILDTPISPELLPPDEQGKIAQQTEDLVGPYALHDFFLFYVLRYGYEPKKIYALACRAFERDFDRETVLKWLKVFYRRFFTQQFKRNCMPDGVKVGTVCFSPRGDWRMPSDASSRLWLSQLETL